MINASPGDLERLRKMTHEELMSIICEIMNTTRQTRIAYSEEVLKEEDQKRKEALQVAEAVSNLFFSTFCSILIHKGDISGADVMNVEMNVIVEEMRER